MGVTLPPDWLLNGALDKPKKAKKAKPKTGTAKTRSGFDTGFTATQLADLRSARKSTTDYREVSILNEDFEISPARVTSGSLRPGVYVTTKIYTIFIFTGAQWYYWGGRGTFVPCPSPYSTWRGDLHRVTLADDC